MDIEEEETLYHFRQIDEYEFERFVADLWERYGWKTEVTSDSKDRGVDIVAEKDRPFYQKHFVQVKRWGSDSTVSGPKIQQYSSLRHRKKDIDAVVVVTTSSFSRQAKQEAKDLNVKLVNGSDLCKIISEKGIEDLLKEYTTLGQSSTDETTAEATSQSQDTTAETTPQSQESSGDDRIECQYCQDDFRSEFAIREHLCEDHNRSELSRIDRKRVDLYRESENTEKENVLDEYEEEIREKDDIR